MTAASFKKGQSKAALKALTPGAQHLAYFTTSPRVSESCYQTLGNEVLKALDLGLRTLEVEVIPGTHLSHSDNTQVREAYREICEALKVTAGDLIFCQAALLHNDAFGFPDCLFLSHVLGTQLQSSDSKGHPEYVFQMASTSRYCAKEKCLPLKASSFCLNKGDTWIFDPATPHLAMPTEMTQNSLLILFQAELPCHTLADFKDILTQYPETASKKYHF